MADFDELEFFAGPPRVKITDTGQRASGANLISGIISVPVRRGSTPFLDVKVPFEGASGKVEAIRQAAPQLEAFATALLNLAHEISG